MQPLIAETTPHRTRFALWLAVPLAAAFALIAAARPAPAQVVEYQQRTTLPLPKKCQEGQKIRVISGDDHHVDIDY